MMHRKLRFGEVPGVDVIEHEVPAKAPTSVPKKASSIRHGRGTFYYCLKRTSNSSHDAVESEVA